MKKYKQGFTMLRIFSKFTNYTGGGLYSEWKKRPGSSRMLDGFTMVEMLMVMGIMSVLVVILSQVFGSILTMKLKSQATTAVAQDSRYVISRLAYDIARASDITTGSGSTLRILIGGVPYVYSLQGTSLMLSVNAGAAQSLTGAGTKVTNLSFVRFVDMGAKKSVQINLTIAPTIIQPGGATGERLLTTTIATR